jgi:hypothetical protein
LVNVNSVNGIEDGEPPLDCYANAIAEYEADELEGGAP